MMVPCRGIIQLREERRFSPARAVISDEEKGLLKGEIREFFEVKVDFVHESTTHLNEITKM